MKAWWSNLNQRERRLVISAALLVGLSLLWMLAVKPFINHRRLLQQDLADAQAIYQQMQQQRPEIIKLRGGNTVPSDRDGSLHSAVIATLKQFQLDGEGTSSEEKAKDSVTLKLEGKPFDALARFLSQMDARHAARATRLTLEPADKVGTVDADITLER